MPDIAHITELLNRSQAALNAAAGAIPPDYWRKPSRSGAWSAADVFAHLKMVEEVITDGAARRIGSPAGKLPFWKRIHIPARLAQFRQLKRQSPIPLDPALVLDRDKSLARHGALRSRTLALLAEHRSRDLSGYYWKHPFFGYLNFYEWFALIGHHELRHTKQLQEIIDFFQK
ncbi:MAG: DinB family protein [Acidobacteria bacterium]|nr:DinB family protein [Acidobacteriota bacterium]MBI3663114.1 DinB family protein [Acidobacteriota bacterium]